jgi:hypothetical protein
MLDLVLAPADIDRCHRAERRICRRFGFREKPTRVRFRMLDPKSRFAFIGTGAGFHRDRGGLRRLNPSVPVVFITENEINFLAFPEVPGAMVLFGAGYGFENLVGALAA